MVSQSNHRKRWRGLEKDKFVILTGPLDKRHGMPLRVTRDNIWVTGESKGMV